MRNSTNVTEKEKNNINLLYKKPLLSKRRGFFLIIAIMKAYNLKKTNIQDLYTFSMPFSADNRGAFAKPYQFSAFKDFELKEMYYSFSKKGSIRGMHFQSPPHDHAKIVCCPRGAILDVVLDLRKESPSYGEFETFELSEKEGKAIYIPKGCAHGFQSLEENSMTLYLVSSEYAPDNDLGVLYNSFGLQWPLELTEISERDLSFPELAAFKSPF